MLLEKLELNTHIVLNDNKEVIVENCQKILEFNEICIKVETLNLMVIIFGTDLVAQHFNSDNVSVKGKIQNIELLERHK
ncbi:MAG: YabP/YqfC family sporulation protein [Ruminococcus sp.]|jgi:sporulation protein YqfC|nr:YabP/YqfC family sporulation protein [Ruminococcus sp.]